MINETKQETLSSGAPSFIRNPIKPNDINTILKHAIEHKINDGSKKIHDDTDGSKKIQEITSSSDPCDQDSSSQATQKFKIKWAGDLENQFHKAIDHIGGVDKATPKKILEFMNLEFLTKGHIASKLQKYRQNLKVGEESMKKARIAMYPKFSSAAGFINAQHSYNYNTTLGNNNLFSVQPGYGLGQSSSMMNNNAGLHDSLNYMNRRPTYDLNQTGCKLFPRRGNLGFKNGTLPLKEECRRIPGTSQAPRFGQHGTTSNVLGINYNPTTGTMGSNYAGIRTDENRDLDGLGGIRVNGNGNSTFSGIRVHGTGSGSLQGMSVHGNGHGCLGGVRGHCHGNGSLEGIKVHGNSNDSLGGIKVHGTGTGSVGGMRVHGTGNCNVSLGGIRGHCPGNGSLEGIKDHGNSNDSLSGVRVHGTGTGSVGGIRVHGTGDGNVSLGGIRGHCPGNGSLEGIKVHGNSNDSLSGVRFYGTGTGSVGGIRVHGTGSDNVSLDETFGMNRISNNNMSNHGSSTSMFPSVLSSFLDNRDQSQKNLIAQTRGVIPAVEKPRIFSDHHDINEVFSDTNNSQFHHQNQHQGNLTGVNLEAPTGYPPEDISSWGFNDGTNNEEILNSLATIPEMYFPTQDMNITNQGNNHDEILDSFAANREMHFPTQDMNITNQDNYDDYEDYSNYLIDPDMN